MNKTKPWAELAEKLEADPIRRARMAEYERVIEDVRALIRLRAELGLPEYKVDDELDGDPIGAPITESQEDPYISALRGYIEAMGGRLEINAVFPDGIMALLPGRRWAASVRTK
jgi:hypothetical protein